MHECYMNRYTFLLHQWCFVRLSYHHELNLALWKKQKAHKAKIVSCCIMKIRFIEQKKKVRISETSLYQHSLPSPWQYDIPTTEFSDQTMLGLPQLFFFYFCFCRRQYCVWKSDTVLKWHSWESVGRLLVWTVLKWQSSVFTISSTWNHLTLLNKEHLDSAYDQVCYLMKE